MTSAGASQGIKDEKDAVQFLMDYLSAREYRSADRQEFEEFLTIQARRWRELGSLADLGRAVRRDDNEEMLRRLRESMTSEVSDGRLLVKSSIPVLLQNLSHEETASLQGFSNLVFAAFLLHIRPVIEQGGSYNSQTRDTIDTAFIAADIARFHDVRMLLREVSVEVDRLGASSEQIRATHTRGVQQLASQLEQAVQAERERAEKFSALENALKTKLALEEPVKLWDAKTAAHTRSFWTGLLLLGSGLIRSTIQERRPSRQRRGSFVPACRSALRSA